MPSVISMPLPVTPPAYPGDIQEGGALVAPKPIFIPAPKCAKVEMRVVEEGEPAENVLYFYQSAGNFTMAQLETLANAVEVGWVAHLAPVMNTATNLFQVRASDMSSRTGPVWEDNPEPAPAGTDANDPAPNTLCIGIGTHTGFKGRSSNGRIFTTGAVDNQFVLSLPTDAARVAVLNAWIDFFSYLTGLGYTFVLVSFQSNKLWRSVAQVTTIAFLTAGINIYTMRRRLPGHNRHR